MAASRTRCGNPIVLPLAPDALAAPRRAAGLPSVRGRSGGCFWSLLPSSPSSAQSRGKASAGTLIKLVCVSPHPRTGDAAHKHRACLARLAVGTGHPAPEQRSQTTRLSLSRRPRARRKTGDYTESARPKKNPLPPPGQSRQQREQQPELQLQLRRPPDVRI